MEKAFDFANLTARLKARGLDLAEEAAKILAQETLNWAEESVKLTENKFDDFFLVVRPMIEPELKAQIDKIDGQVG